MEISPKSPEAIKAQIAAFNAEYIEPYSDRAYILTNLGRLASGAARDETRILERDEFHHMNHATSTNPNGLVKSGTEITVATKQAYIDFLRKTKGKDADVIRVRTELQEAYKEFEPTIRTLREELADPAERHNHAGHIGAGLNSQVFVIQQDGKDFAVRVPRGDRNDSFAIDSHLAAAAAIRGVPHYEKIVAASYEDGVTIAEMMPGKEIGSLTLEDIEHISDEQLAGLLDTLIAGEEKGIVIDPNASNYFYDRNEGFGILDISVKTSKQKNVQDIKAKVIEAAIMLAESGLHAKPHERREAESQEYYVEQQKFAVIHIALLERYRNVIEHKNLSGNDEAILTGIDELIVSLKEKSEQYANPEWVAKRIEVEKHWRQMREKNGVSAKGLSGWDKVTVDADIV